MAFYVRVAREGLCPIPRPSFIPCESLRVYFSLLARRIVTRNSLRATFFPLLSHFRSLDPQKQAFLLRHCCDARQQPGLLCSIFLHLPACDYAHSWVPLRCQMAFLWLGHKQASQLEAREPSQCQQVRDLMERWSPVPQEPEGPQASHPRLREVLPSSLAHPDVYCQMQVCLVWRPFTLLHLAGPSYFTEWRCATLHRASLWVHFSNSVVHFVSLGHILVVLTIFQMFSLYLCWRSVIRNYDLLQAEKMGSIFSNKYF